MEEESSEEEEEEAPVITVKQAKESMDVISQFFYANNFISHNSFQSFQRAFYDHCVSVSKQTKITDYFVQKDH